MRKTEKELHLGNENGPNVKRKTEMGSKMKWKTIMVLKIVYEKAHKYDPSLHCSWFSKFDRSKEEEKPLSVLQ